MNAPAQHQPGRESEALPAVNRRCQRCEAVTLSREAWSENRIVSPRRIMHLVGPDGPWTLCGQHVRTTWRTWEDS